MVVVIVDIHHLDSVLPRFDTDVVPGINSFRDGTVGCRIEYPTCRRSQGHKVVGFGPIEFGTLHQGDDEDNNGSNEQQQRIAKCAVNDVLVVNGITGLVLLLNHGMCDFLTASARYLFLITIVIIIG